MKPENLSWTLDELPTYVLNFVNGLAVQLTIIPSEILAVSGFPPAGIDLPPDQTRPIDLEPGDLTLPTGVRCNLTVAESTGDFLIAATYHAENSNFTFAIEWGTHPTITVEDESVDVIADVASTNTTFTIAFKLDPGPGSLN